MKVIWSDFATETLRDIYVYYKEAAGKTTADRIKHTIFSATKQLVKYPGSGRVEEHLTILGEDHRCLIKGNYKIVYKPVKEGILITDVFDTRQDPKKINVRSRKTGR
jgi:plasmid stabilization system protein ParE